MAKAKKAKLSEIHEMLPMEMMEKILKLLNYNDICQAKLVCRRWKEVIVNGHLLKKAAGKNLFLSKTQNLCYVTRYTVSFSIGKMHCIMVAGVFKSGFSPVEVLCEDLGSKKLPNLPKKISNSTISLHDGTILICGGRNNLQKCLQIRHGNWVEHSTLNKLRLGHSAVATPSATFLFGGHGSTETYEYLPKDSKTWQNGKTNIPEGFADGCAIALKSNQDILLIGGSGGITVSNDRILSFDVKDHTFFELPFVLNVGRFGHTCVYIPNTNKIMIAGGYRYFLSESTEKRFHEN